MARPPVLLVEIAAWLKTSLQADLPAKLAAAGLDPIHEWYTGDPIVDPNSAPNMPMLTVGFGMPEGGLTVDWNVSIGGHMYHYRYCITIGIGTNWLEVELANASGYLAALKECLDGYMMHIDGTIHFRAGRTQDGSVGFIRDSISGFDFIGASWTWGCDSAIS